MNLKRRNLLAASAFCLIGMPASAISATRLEGINVPDSIIAHGRRLNLNGAGVRKRGYFKANVVALYLPDRLMIPESIFNLDGPRRIQLSLLRDFSSSTISRIFLADFKQTATEAEFKQLINEISEIGAIYGSIKKIGAGDVVNIDWVPGQGIVTSLNDHPLGEKPINSELAYKIYLRMFIGPTVPDDLRNALLGLTK